MDNKIMNEYSQEAMSEVPKIVCEKFIEELQSADIPKNTIEKLSKTLLKKNNFTENAIRNALFSSSQEL